MAKPIKMPTGMEKRGNNYYAKFRSNGQLIRRVLSSDFAVAKVMLKDLRMKVYRENNGDIDNEFNIEELYKQWLRSITQRLALDTVKRYRQNIANVRRLIPVRTVNLLSIDIIEEFRETRLDEGAKASTVNKDVGALSGMLDWGVQREKIGSNPIKNLKKLREQKKEERALEVSEMQEILFNSTEHWRRIWNAYFASGLRKMELANLLFSDIDWDAKEIIVRATLTKNSLERRIPIDEHLYEILLLQRKAAGRRKPGSWSDKATTERIRNRFSKKHVFVTSANTPLGGNLYRSFIAACKKCEIELKKYDAKGNLIEVVTLHSTRHSFATDLIRNNADPRTVQKLMGHKTLDMTMRIYAKVNDTQKRDAIGKLSLGKSDQSEKTRLNNKK